MSSPIRQSVPFMPQRQAWCSWQGMCPPCLQGLEQPEDRPWSCPSLMRNTSPPSEVLRRRVWDSLDPGGTGSGTYSGCTWSSGQPALLTTGTSEAPPCKWGRTLPGYPGGVGSRTVVWGPASLVCPLM